MNEKILSLQHAIDLSVEVLMRAKTAKANAEIVAQALVLAESDGLKGHGLSRLPSYCAQSLTGKINGEALPTAFHETPALIKIDAAHGFAYPALKLAEAELAKALPKSGVVALSISRSHHCGAAGHVVERLAEKGFISMLFANTPAAIAPWGGNKGVFGTNPVAFGVPLKGKRPVVVDMAISKVARGPIVAAAQRGEDIPLGWALDSQGQPTTSAKAALAGTMLPLGEAKGTALAFMIEVLAAGLTGASFAAQASSFLTPEGSPPNTGQLIIGFDPKRFYAGFEAHLLTLIEDIEGQEGARLSGYRRYDMREKAKTNGVILTKSVQQELLALKLTD